MDPFLGSPFGTLPRELREEIWILALLPNPGVYHFDPNTFTITEDDNFEDERLLIPKRKFPTAMHLCQESRQLSLAILDREQASDAPKLFFLGDPVRVLDPEMDTIWFDTAGHMAHGWVRNTYSVIGSRIHTFQNLALSSRCIQITADPARDGISTWAMFRWEKLPRFVSLRHVDIVFGEEFHTTPSAHGLDGAGTGLSDVPEIRLEAWVPGSSDDTEQDVLAKMSMTERDTREGFKDMYDDREEEEERLPLPDDAPGWQDGSQITFRAARMVRVTTYLNRPKPGS